MEKSADNQDKKNNKVADKHHRSVTGFLKMQPPTTTHNDLEIRYRRRNNQRIPYVGKSKALQEVEDTYMANLVQYIPKTPLTGALRLSVAYCFGCDDAKLLGKPKISKPDLDNLDKTFRDCLTKAGIISDDANIVNAKSTKAYSQPAGVFFRVEEVDGWIK